MNTIKVGQLEKDIEAFLVFKRKLGFKYARAEYTLKSFLRFASSCADKSGAVSFDDTLSSWLARIKGRMPVTVALDLGVIRQLCLYKRRRNHQVFVPDRSWAPQQVESSFLPYVFSIGEIRTILSAAKQYQSRTLDGETLYGHLLVLYCTGLRPGESINLTLTDTNLDVGVFTIQQSKGRERHVPFGDDLSEKLRSYLEYRSTISADHDGLWIQRNGAIVHYGTMYDGVRRLFVQLGMKPTHGRVGPRPYDMRHTFAVHRLTEWYKQGSDCHAQLPWLSAYMGHDNILGTEAYLHATPELLAIASNKFSQHACIGSVEQ